MLKIAFFAVFFVIAMMITSLIYPGIGMGVVLPVAALLAGAWYLYKRRQREYMYGRRQRASRQVKKQPNPLISKFTERIVQKDVDVAGLISELRAFGQGAGLSEAASRDFLVDAWASAANAGENFRHMPHILDNLDRARRELSLSQHPSVGTGNRFHEKFRTLFEISNGSVPEWSGLVAGIPREVLPEDKVVWVEPSQFFVAGDIDYGKGTTPWRTLFKGYILITNHCICFRETPEHQITQEPQNDSFRLRRATTMTPFGVSTSGDEFILERANPVHQEQLKSGFSFAKTESVDSNGKYFLIHLDDLKGFKLVGDTLRFKHKGHWARKLERRSVKYLSFDTGDGQFLYTLVTLLKRYKPN